MTLDRTWRYVDVYVVARPSRGRCVIAARPFLPNDVIERCPVIELNWLDRALLRWSAIRRHVYCWGPDSKGRVVVLGNGMLYNHSDNPNADFVESHATGEMVFVALQPIGPHEEIVVDYGVKLWFKPSNQ